ncbi:MAG: bacteriohemerythrin [Alphaproteobacteria bacterium]|nr:bacteriohemerythrin [Alphaproteobacteria bacterium]
MAFFEWSEEISVGIEIIDEEHKIWISYVNDLHEAISSDQTNAILNKLIESIIAYSFYHFKQEEALFSQTDYPDVLLHKNEHQKHLQYMSDFQNKFRANKADPLSIDFLFYMKKWLINHIQEMDQQYVSYVKAKGLILK